jgi:hypothetical protein
MRIGITDARSRKEAVSGTVQTIRLNGSGHRFLTGRRGG